MGQTIVQLQFRWNVLRVISWIVAVTTQLVIIGTIPARLLLAGTLVVILGAAAATLAIIRWRRVWVCLTISAQAFLFVIGLASAVSGQASTIAVPILIVAFPLILASEHVLSNVSRYSRQSSVRAGGSVEEYNAQALNAALNHLYRNLARDGIIFGGAILLSLAVGMGSTIGLTVPLLSDPSLYAIAASISLALLIISRKE